MKYKDQQPVQNVESSDTNTKSQIKSINQDHLQRENESSQQQVTKLKLATPTGTLYADATGCERDINGNNDTNKCGRPKQIPDIVALCGENEYVSEALPPMQKVVSCKIDDKVTVTPTSSSPLSDDNQEEFDIVEKVKFSKSFNSHVLLPALSLSPTKRLKLLLKQKHSNAKVTMSSTHNI